MRCDRYYVLNSEDKLKTILRSHFRNLIMPSHLLISLFFCSFSMDVAFGALHSRDDDVETLGRLRVDFGELCPFFF